MRQEPRSSRIAVLLFTDMVDSVALEHAAGTMAYSRLLRLHHQLFAQALEIVGSGKIHADTGDGFLAEFSTAADAVNAGLLFQFLLHEADWGGPAPKVRIGVHQGQLAEIQMDEKSSRRIVGIPVSIASRVMGLAKASQILMTRSVFDDARQFIREHPITKVAGYKAPALKWKSHGQYVFKGADSPIDVYEVGAAGMAPLAAPFDSEKARRLGSAAPMAAATGRRPWLAAGLTAATGLLLLTRIGDAWVNASYDYLLRFGGRTVTNKVALILMDSEAYTELKQDRDKPWDRALHAKLLNKLAADGCPLVVMDIFFPDFQTNATDVALAEAMNRVSNVVLMAGQSGAEHPGLVAARPILPADPFVTAARNNWGVAWYDSDIDSTVRRHWPFPSPGPYPSLAWTSALVAGARLPGEPSEKWLRYYEANGPWVSLSYHLALEKPPNFFSDRTVFIGNKPKTTRPDGETDKFSTPFTRWSGEAVGGIELHATAFLNLMNADWLRRLDWPIEAVLVMIFGAVIGYFFSRISSVLAWAMAAGLIAASVLAGVLLTHFSNVWFPWLVLAMGQIPCALVLGLVPFKTRRADVAPSAPSQPKTLITPAPEPDVPEAPEYEIISPAFGEGGFGKVWLARSAVGQWQALKAVYLSKFDGNPGPYGAEFEALKKYKPVSEKHPGLLRIELISRKKTEGYFYYVMELGDSRVPGWARNPALYRPRDLESERQHSPGKPLRLRECVRIGVALADALHFLHSAGLTHRDIKPSNIIFVNGQPKLADVGLLTDIRPAGMIRTWVGTTGYVPAPPEKAGSVPADIFALGMVLYVISTGRDPDTFSDDFSTPFLDTSELPIFMKLRAIILKACHSDPAKRYPDAAEFREALKRCASEENEAMELV